ncbi:TPA: hypothetical protein KDY05_002243 [Vibrio parahaemolyticus]|nr:hypothetical protein [Vibrio parahaemolyticus]
MAYLSMTSLTILMVFNYLIFKKISTAFFCTLMVALAMLTFITAGNTYVQRDFYGDEAVEKFETKIAIPKIQLGNALSPTKFLEAKVNDDGSYSCDHVTRTDGKHNVFGATDDALFCCSHDVSRDGYLAPYKLVDNKLHVLCGTFPMQNEVVLNEEETKKFNFF